MTKIEANKDQDVIWNICFLNQSTFAIPLLVLFRKSPQSETRAYEIVVKDIAPNLEV